MRLLLGASVLATATACGAKHDPYAASLAKGSEHVTIRGLIDGRVIRGSGDFAGTKGTVHVRDGKTEMREVVVGRRIYLEVGGSWTTTTTNTILSPAQVFRRRLPAHIENGLVRSVTMRNSRGHETITFSNYGEHVSVTVPRVKGSK